MPRPITVVPLVMQLYWMKTTRVQLFADFRTSNHSLLLEKEVFFRGLLFCYIYFIVYNIYAQCTLFLKVGEISLALMIDRTNVHIRTIVRMNIKFFNQTKIRDEVFLTRGELSFKILAELGSFN